MILYSNESIKEFTSKLIFISKIVSQHFLKLRVRQMYFKTIVTIIYLNTLFVLIFQYFENFPCKTP